MQTSAKGRADLKLHEGEVLKAYRDPVGVLTIGVGITSAAGVVKVTPGMVITREESDRLLAEALARVPPLREGETGKKRHGDYAIALALAHWASRMRWSEYSYRGAVSSRGQGRGQLADDGDDEVARWRQPLGARLRGWVS